MEMAEPEVGLESGRRRIWYARLTRLRLALSSRDWIAILIELIVVTAGVLLAFQADQWGQDRRQAREERQFLNRMWSETALAIRENDGVIRFHRQAIREFTQALHASHDPAALARYAATPDFGCMVGLMPGLGFNDTSYAELTASGRLNLLRDPQIRADLRDVIAAQANSVAQLTYARMWSTTMQEKLDRYYLLDLDERGRRQCRMDWPGIVKDQLARNSVVRSARFHTLMLLRRLETRNALALAHNRIACALGKNDCRANVQLIPERL